jgi:hypothetical protein
MASIRVFWPNAVRQRGCQQAGNLPMSSANERKATAEDFSAFQKEGERKGSANV